MQGDPQEEAGGLGQAEEDRQGAGEGAGESQQERGSHGNRQHSLSGEILISNGKFIFLPSSHS